MAALLQVVPEPLNSPPRIRIIVTAMAGDTVTVTRRNVDGSAYSVRTGNPGTLDSPGTWTGYDYESPFALAGTYKATSNTGDTVLATVPALREYGVRTPWLIHPGIPGLSLPVNVARPGPLPSSEINQGVFAILGRPDPIVRTDGVRRAPTFTLTLSTSTWDDQDALMKILSDASTLLLQVTYPEWERGDYWWISVSTVTPIRLVDYFGGQDMQWALACTVTGSPAGLLQAQWTCAGVVNAYASSSDVVSAYATSQDLLINFPIAS